MDILQPFESNGNFYVFIHILDKQFRDNLCPGETLVEIRRRFIGYGKDKFKSLKETIEGIEISRDAVPVSFVMKFIYKYYNSHQFCRKLATDIESQLLKDHILPQKDISVDDQNGKLSIRNLYKDIAKHEFMPESVFQLLQLREKIEDSLPKQNLEYKEELDMTDKQWNNILYFEFQFLKEHPLVSEYDYDKSLDSRYQFWKVCKDAIDLGNYVFKQSKMVIKDRQMRREEANKLNGIKLHCDKQHLPSVIEQNIIEEVNMVYSESISVTCVDGFNSIKENTMYIFHNSHSDISAFVSRILGTNHKISGTCFVQLSTQCMEHYMDSDAQNRYTLRNDFLSGKLKGKVVSVTNLTYNVKSASEESPLCTMCFPSSNIQPLSYSDFDLFVEWTEGLPVTMQIFLSKFLNKKSLVDSKDEHGLLFKKIEKLYTVYDILLNVINRNHIGVFQEANTKELVLGYRSAGTTFRLTSRSGITMSENAAEKVLTTNSSSDKTHYNAIMKPHQYKYFAVDGQLKQEARMISCHVTILIDNLVRWKIKSDPNPGDCRTKQLDLLPVSLQGVPKDDIITKEWHNPSICNGLNNCPCKEKVKLNKTDVQHAIFQKSSKEQQMMDQMNTLMTWSLMELWTEIKQSKYTSYFSLQFLTYLAYIVINICLVSYILVNTALYSDAKSQFSMSIHHLKTTRIKYTQIIHCL